MTTLTEALTFITGEATGPDLERILDAVKTRRRIVGAMRAATVAVGAQVTLTGLSPKALNGLKGKVTTISGNRGNVELDRDGTETLAYSNTRFRVQALTSLRSTDDEFRGVTIAGVPLQCCEVAE